MRSIRRPTLRRSSRSVSATSPAGVPSTSIASSARSSGSTRWAAASSPRIERRQRGAAAGDDADRLEQLGGLGRLVDQPVRAGHAGQQRVGLGRVEDHLRRVRQRLQAAAQRQAVAVGQVVLEQHHVRPQPLDELDPVVAPGGAPTGTRPGSVRRSIARPARTAGWGSTMAMRVTAGTLPTGLNPA